MARSLIRAVVCAVLLSLIAAPVLAHAELVSATPGPGDEVAGSPSELVGTFNQDLDPSRTSLEVRDASGASLARGGELGQGSREFRLILPRLGPGEYEVRWTSFSAEDGELERGSYAFTVIAAPSSPPSPSLSPTPTAPPPVDGTSAGGDGAVLIPILAALLVVGGIGAWLLRRRAT